jgi:hypothetical protein
LERGAERRKGWMARIAAINHCIKIEKREERPRGRYSQYFTASVFQAQAMMKARSRPETADEGGYDDGTFHPSANPYSGGPEQAVHRVGCMHGV